MLGIGTQEMARLRQDELRHQAAAVHLAVAHRPPRWRHTVGDALVRLGTRLSGPDTETALGRALAPPARACG